MPLLSKKSKAKRYFAIGLISLIVGISVFLYVDSIADIPREYVWGNFQLNQIGTPFHVYMIATIEPKVPRVIGQEILVTVVRSDTLEPLPDRFIIIRDAEGNDVGGRMTNASGQSVEKYAGEGSIMRITSDGSYIRDAIIFFSPQEKWIVAASIVYLSSIVGGIAVGIGLYFLSKNRHWL